MSDPDAAPVLPAPAGEDQADSAQHSRDLLVGYTFAAIGSILFSAKGIIIKLAYAEGIDPETLIALRMLLAMPFYLAIGGLAVRSRRRLGTALPSAPLVAKAALIGALGYWLASYLDFVGLTYISAQFERLILFTYPLFVVVFGAMFFNLPVQRRALMAFAASYAGLALIFTAKVRDLGSDVTLGAGLVVVSAAVFAMFQLLAKGLIGQIGPRLFTCVAMTAAGAVAIAQFLITKPAASILVSPVLLGYGLLLAIAATVLPSFFMNAALHRISAQANATIGTMSPVATIIMAVVILGEVLTTRDVIGTALVLGGVGWFTLGGRRRKAVPQAS